MGDFFGAAAAIGTFIAVLVAAISSTGWVIGRTVLCADGSVQIEQHAGGFDIEMMISRAPMKNPVP